MKIVIVGGAGGTGSSIAFSLLRCAAAHEIVLVDNRAATLTSHVMDLENAAAIGSWPHSVREGTTDDIVTAGLVVLCASVPLRPNISRGDFLAGNAFVLSEYVPVLAAQSFAGAVLLVTNPVDALLTWLLRRTGLAPHRLVGYALNDTLRIRTGVAQTLGVHPTEVVAWTVGEHGEHQVPLFSRITVRGKAVSLTPEQIADVNGYISTWYTRHVSLGAGRTSTWATGLGAAHVIEAMESGSGQVIPASTVLSGQYGVSGVAVGVPVILDPYGVRSIIEWELDSAEQKALIHAATQVSQAAESLEDLVTA